MNIVIISLLAVSLSIDALGIGISYGLRKIKVPWIARIIICIISMVFTALSLTVGNAISNVFPHDIAKIVGSIMMILFGAFIIYQAFHKEENKKRDSKKDTIANIVLKPFGITIKIIRNPILCDMDKSSHIDSLEAIYLGTALSIDSFGVGVSTAISGTNSIFIPIAVGIFQLIFLSIGGLLGKRISMSSKINSKNFVILSGVILILLSIIKFLI